MKIVDDVREFLTRKRRWRWIVAALALAILGQAIDAFHINWLGLPAQGRDLSFALYDRLRVIQPDTVVQRYAAATAGRHGIGRCGPTSRMMPSPAVFVPKTPGLQELTPLPRTPVLNPSLFPDRSRHSGSRAAEVLRETPSPRPSVITTPNPTPRSSPPPLDTTRKPRGGSAAAREIAGEPAPPLSPEEIAALLERARAPQRGATSTVPKDLDPALVDAIERQTSTATLQAERATAAARSDWDCSSGVLRLADRIAGALRVTPEVASELWQTGWVNRLLLLLTAAGIGAALVAIWRRADAIGAGVIPATVAVVLIGPVAMAFVFWLLLQLLLGLVFALGLALAGVSAIIGGVFALWKIGSMYVAALQRADSLEQHAERAREIVDDLTPPR